MGVIFFFLLIGTLGVLGFGGFMLWKEDKQSSQVAPTGTSAEAMAPPEPKPSQETSAKPGPMAILANLLQKKEKPDTADSSSGKPSKKSPLSGLLDKLKTPVAKGKGGNPLAQITAKFSKTPKKEAPAGTSALRLDDVFSKDKQGPEEQELQPTPAAPPKPPAADKEALKPEKGPADEINARCQQLEQQIAELEEKYQQLDKLFQEKSKALEETQTDLDSELQNRKEFNKVKDMLEKELKDSKDRCRDLEISLSNAETESKSHLERISQLEEKITTSEQDLKTHDQELEKAQKDEEQAIKDNTQLTQKTDQAQEEIKLKDKKIHDLVDHFKDQETSGPSELKPTESPKPAPEPEKDKAESDQQSVMVSPPEDAEESSQPKESSEAAEDTSPTKEGKPAEETSPTHPEKPTETAEPEIQKTDPLSDHVSAYFIDPDEEPGKPKSMESEKGSDKAPEPPKPKDSQGENESASSEEPKNEKDSVSLAPDILSNKVNEEEEPPEESETNVPPKPETPKVNPEISEKKQEPKQPPKDNQADQ